MVYALVSDHDDWPYTVDKGLISIISKLVIVGFNFMFEANKVYFVIIISISPTI